MFVWVKLYMEEDYKSCAMYSDKLFVMLTKIFKYFSSFFRTMENKQRYILYCRNIDCKKRIMRYFDSVKTQYRYHTTMIWNLLIVDVTNIEMQELDELFSYEIIRWNKIQQSSPQDFKLYDSITI